MTQSRESWIREQAYYIWELRYRLGFPARPPEEDWEDAEFRWEQYQEHIKRFHEQFDIYERQI